MRIPVLLLAAAAACSLAPPVAAERADREKEIVVGADHLVADDAKHTSTFEGNVVVTQGTMRMTAKQVTVQEDPDRHKHYTAHGAPVTFRQKRDNADEWVEGFADRAEFDDRTDMLRLYGHAKVKTNQNEITGDFISYDMRRELAEVMGAPPGVTPPRNSRVKVIIVPPKKGPEPAAPPPLELKPDPGKR